ncbi:EAL domain-containing protein [Burkholderia guangdongensis]|uniref:EAL domain-containing protein n=1 Tax=Burkholderia guangdongensis TaxID=1792500 RepID=UPI0015C8988A|nr:cyclic diguanylate phosphodiesterase [Burkholderia guangdongensis]
MQTTLAPEFRFPRRGAWHRLGFLVALNVGLLVLLAAIALSDHYADDAIAKREYLIANGVVSSVDRILNDITSRNQEAFTTLRGQPCATIFQALSESASHFRYIREVALVTGGRVYCSSASGPIDVPVATYLPTSPRPGATRATLLPQTPFQPGIPVLVAYRATARDAGVLYVIEGDYIADILAGGTRYGAATATLSMNGKALLSDQRKLMQDSSYKPERATRIASKTWPFTVSVSPSEEYVSHVCWKYRLIFLTIGLLLNCVVAAIYLLVFAPRRMLLKAVRDAIRRNEFHLEYQPIVSIESRALVGVEALLRWNHPKWGAISPAAFMPDVESSTMLAKVTAYVLRTTIADMKAHRPPAPLRLAVNVGPKDMERPQFTSEVVAVISRLPPGVTLVLELTERFLLEKSSRTMSIFQALRSQGVKFAIDDFGTHHSNLDLLARYPFDYVKIDRQFVAELETSGARLVQGLVSVAEHFDLEIIAEGVETEEQHNALREIGVEYAQGYLYQRPLRAEDLRNKWFAPSGKSMSEAGWKA